MPKETAQPVTHDERLFDLVLVQLPESSQVVEKVHLNSVLVGRTIEIDNV
jgi:hypothetical protein